MLEQNSYLHVPPPRAYRETVMIDFAEMESRVTTEVDGGSEDMDQENETVGPTYDLNKEHNYACEYIPESIASTTEPTSTTSVHSISSEPTESGDDIFPRITGVMGGYCGSFPIPETQQSMDGVPNSQVNWILQL